MVCLDVFLLIASFLCIAGSVGSLYILIAREGASSIDQAFMLMLSAFVTAVSLSLLLAWGFSYRLTIINRQLQEIRRDLNQLIRRIEH